MQGDERTAHEHVLDGVMRAQGLLGQLTRYVEEMEAIQPSLTAEQMKLVHDYATKEIARMQHYIASVSAALLELQSITGAPVNPRPQKTVEPPRQLYFAGGPGDDIRRRAIKADARKTSQQKK